MKNTFKKSQGIVLMWVLFPQSYYTGKIKLVKIAAVVVLVLK